MSYRASSNAAFSLVEMMIATAASMAIILMAMAGYRSASGAMAAASKFTDETMLLAAGVQAAYAENDEWRFYDDPAADTTLHPERQALRKAVSIPANTLGMYEPNLNPPSTNVIRSDSVTPTPYTFGLPFSRLQDTYNATGQNLGAKAPSNPSAWLRDGVDHEDECWAISAGNPLTWWTANVQAGLGSLDGQSGGTYAGGTNNLRVAGTLPIVLRRGYHAIFGVSGALNPALPITSPSGLAVPSGQGWTARIGNSLTLLQGSTIPGSYYPGYGDVQFLATTDPYHDVLLNQSARTHGWVFNQIRSIQNALGFYGMLDYLPVGMMPIYPIAEAPKYGVSSYGNVNGLDVTDWDQFPLQLTYGFAGYNDGVIGGNFANSLMFNLCAAETMDQNGFNHRGIPGLDRLLTPGGFSIIPWCNELDQAGIRLPSATGTPTTSLVSSTRTRDLLHYHRAYFSWGDSPDFLCNGQFVLRQTPMFYDLDPNGMIRTKYPDYTLHAGYIDPMIMEKFLKRTTGTMRLIAATPMTWPGVSVSVSHHIRLNKFINVAKVSVVNPTTGKTYELRFSLMGTTLRGARRQRQLDNQ